MNPVTRRQWMAVAAGGALASRSASAQRPYPGVNYRDYTKCLPDYLRDLSTRAYQKRNRDLASLTTSAKISARQHWVRETFWTLVGGAPERTPPNARVVGSLDRSGYRLEKIIYESRPNFHIPANLYIPAGVQPPFPGVLFQMGHSANGKAWEVYQRCCQGLARLGYLVLAFDPMGQGERIYYPDSSGVRTRLSSADDEHTMPGRQLLLTGGTTTQLQVWDAVRSLDYLAAHPLVDPKRLGGTGQSGGAMLTSMLACVDDRLAAIALASSNTENIALADFNPPGSTDDAEQDFVGSGPLGFDRFDLLYPIAPKPLLVLNSAKDFYGTYSPRYISNTWEEFQKLERIYAVLGHKNHLRMADTPLPHGLSYSLRLEIYNWFEQWLKPSGQKIDKEAPFKLEKDETLWASPTGNTARDFHGVTPFRLAQQRAASIKTPTQVSNLEASAGIERPAANLRASILSTVPSGDLQIQAMEVPSSPKIWVPAWAFVPAKRQTDKPAIILIEQGGRNGRWAEGELYQSLATAGLFVVAADVRGMGDLTPEFGRGNPGYMRAHQGEEDFAWASLILGKPLVGQRVTDILALVEAVSHHPAAEGRRIVLAASGSITVPALIAAALAKNIDNVYLAQGLVSYRNILEIENYTHPLSNFLPDILKHTDLPEIAASMAPRRVRIAGAVDAANRKLTVEAARRIYQTGNVECSAEVGWTVERLGAL